MVVPSKVEMTFMKVGSHQLSASRHLKLPGMPDGTFVKNTLELSP